MKKSVVLNMIVKNEADIIERCLDQVVPWIDYWVIVDTGSTDDTRALIERKLAAAPGELHERPWVNFGHNRTEALRLAEGKADYILLTDADMMFETRDPEWKTKLDGEGLMVEQRHGEEGFRYRNLRLVNGRLEGEKRWVYRGSTHEYLDSETPDLNGKTSFDAVAFLDLDDGGAKADKFERDVRLLSAERAELEEAVARAEDDDDRAALEKQLARCCFYLGQSHQALARWEDAIEAYRARLAFGGWIEEQFVCHRAIGMALERMGAPEGEAEAAYLRAYEAAPHRAESLYELQRLHNDAGRRHLAFLFGETATRLTKPDGLFVEPVIYDRLAKDQHAVAAFWTGRYGLSAQLCNDLLKKKALSPADRARIEDNLAHARAQLRETAPRRPDIKKKRKPKR